MTRPDGGVLVLDGHVNYALACTRSLGRAGYTVFVASDRRWPLAAWSHHCEASFLLDGETIAAFATLRAWAVDRGVTTVLPLTERSCQLCDADRRAWESAGITVGCATGDTLHQAFDKAITVERAAACGVRTPPTRVPTSLADGRASAEEVGFPCVIKQRFTHAWDGTAFLPSQRTGYVSHPKDVEAALLAGRQGEHWPLVQAYVPGCGKGAFALCDHGRALAWFAHERLRDVRPTGSGSTLRRSVPLDPRLHQPAERLLAELRWHGPAMVEFRDDGVQDPWLMEVNGRFWNSLELAVRAGADFPRWWLAVLRGESMPAVPPYAEGLTMRWLPGDFKRLLYILAGPPRGYTGPYPTVRQGLKEIFGRQPPGTRSDTWDRRDPWPAVGEWVHLGRELLAHTRGRKRGGAPAPQDATNGKRPAAGVPAPATLPAAGRALRVLMITSDWPDWAGPPRTTHFIKRQADFLQRAGMQVDVLHFRGGKNVGNYVRTWLEARRRLRGEAYDLVHAQFGQSGLLALPKRVPLVVTFRGSDLLGIISEKTSRNSWVGRLAQRISRFVARRADAVIVVSEHMKAFLPPRVSAHVIPSGLDLTLFRPIPQMEARCKLGLSPARRLVLFVGSPTKARKRYHLAKRAVALVDGGLGAELVVAWRVPHTDIPTYMSAADVLVCTSLQEGSPNVVKEALACDLPVVSVPVGDVPERLGDVEGCEVCVDDRPETLAAALERVLRRGERVNGRAAVAALDEHLLTARVIGVYRAALNGTPPLAAKAKRVNGPPVAFACVMGDTDLLRPLGLAGIPCAVVAKQGAPARFSRFARIVLPWRDAWERPDELVQILTTFGASQPEPPVLFYQEDREVLLVSRYRDELSQHFRFVIAGATLVEDLVDKSRFQVLASRLGLPVPRARTLDATAGPPPRDLDLQFPIVIKPLTRRTDRWAPLGGLGKALCVATPAHLTELWPRLAATRQLVIAQELIPGPESAIESYHVYVDELGETVAEFTGRKIRTHPTENGHSTALEITAVSDVAALGRNLVHQIGLRGVAKFDFKRAPDGRLHLLEINPRFTLWHHPAAVAGVNVPLLVYGELTGAPRPPLPQARAGVQWCKLWQDWAPARAAGVPLWRWLPWALRREAKCAVAWDDPFPLIGAALWLLARARA